MLLYEFGALQDFLVRIASADLLARADHIHGWARTPMGGFRVVRESPQTVTWQNLATSTEHESLNLGAASLLEPGECAIGRLVPIEGGAMFETAPLFVPDDVARPVAEDPSGWVAAVSAGCRRERPHQQQIRTDGHDFRLLTDVPTRAQLMVAYSVIKRASEESSPLSAAPDPVAARAALVRAALDGEVGASDHVVSPWPSVAASLLEPSVFVELCSSLVPADGAKLTVLADQLAAPARALCLSLAEDLERAA